MRCGSAALWERLTRQFYDWEIRGRGWQVYGQPVALEPPFRPFFGHIVSGGITPSVDDGRQPTFLSSLFDKPKLRSVPPPLPIDETEPEPHYIELVDESLVEIQIALPAETKVTAQASSQFLLSLGYVSRPICFEIVGTNEETIVQVTSALPDRRQVREQLQAYFPEAVLTERCGYVRDLWDRDGRCDSLVVDFGLSKEFMRPLRRYERFDPDPLVGVIGAMTDFA